MIQIIFESDQITPEWEHDEERLALRLSPAQVSRSTLLHGKLDEAGLPVQATEAWGRIATRYVGETARQVRVILELPDDVWDDLAERADALLDQAA
jgi:hypothetical protein